MEKEYTINNYLYTLIILYIVICKNTTVKHRENVKHCPEYIVSNVLNKRLFKVLLEIELSGFEFLSFVTIWVLSFATIWVFALCHNLCFWVFSQLGFCHSWSFQFSHFLFLSLVKIQVFQLLHFDFLSFVTI